METSKRAFLWSSVKGCLATIVIYGISSLLWIGVGILFFAILPKREPARSSMGFAISIDLQPLFTAIIIIVALSTLVLAPLTTFFMVRSLSDDSDTDSKQKEKRKHGADL